MAVKSRGRGTVAALWLLCLFVGLVGGAVLYLVAERRPTQAVENFARAPVGCITTLEFAETGTFYVFEEVGADTEAIGNGCEPTVDPSARFAVEFTGPLQPSVAAGGDVVSYDVAGYDGRSIRQLEITQPGQYTIEVTGDDPTVAAAIGRDPHERVDDLHRAALILAVAGTLLGLVLLTLSGRRSKRAATMAPPSGPGWGPAPRPVGEPTVAGGPRTGQVPVNPHAPPAPVSWQPPSGDAADESQQPDASAPPAPPADGPVLPDVPGRTSGT